MPDVKYEISGLEQVTKPGTYTVRTTYAARENDGSVTVYGRLMDQLAGTDDAIAAVSELDSLLMRPIFVHRRATARLHATETRPGQHRSARTQQGNAAGEVLDAVAAWVERYRELLEARRA